MARLKKSTDAIPNARNIKGRLVVKEWRGITIALAWPKPRGPSKKPSENWWRATFGTAAQMAAHPYHLDAEFARAWTENTKYRPEDLLISAALGKLYEFVDPTGTIKGSTLTLGGNPQQTLDLVTNQPGSILWRSAAGWVGLKPPAGGLVLASLGTGALAWTPSENTGDPLDMSPTRLHLTADQTGRNLTGNVVIDWDAADFDIGGRWSAANPARIVFGPADVGRAVLATAALRIDNAAVGQWVSVQIRHRGAGAENKTSAIQRSMIEANTETFNSVSLMTAPLADGDYIEVRPQTQADTNVDIRSNNTYFAMSFVK